MKLRKDKCVHVKEVGEKKYEKTMLVEWVSVNLNYYKMFFGLICTKKNEIKNINSCTI